VSPIGPDELETAAEMSGALVRQEVFSVELVERALSRAEAWQPSTNAFTQLWPDEALAVAFQIDRERPGWHDGPASRRFAGIPIVVKDLFDVAGHETTSCCAAFAGNVAGADAPVIEGIRRAGLVMIGKANQHELAAGGTNLVSAYGRTANPWDPSRMTGGSSGGSAAAVAAGVVPWALGSDTGGSIRIPASMCGTFGLKPTTGQLPIQGLLPLAPSMDCPGPLAGTAADLTLLYRLMGGPAPALRDWPISPRVGMVRDVLAGRVHAEVLAAVEATAAVLAGAGLEVEEVDGGGPDEARRVWTAVTGIEFSRAYESVRDRRHLIDPSVVAWMEIGDRSTPDDEAEAARGREEVRRWFADRLEGRDALLIPTTPYPAPRADEESVDLRTGDTVEVGRVGPGRITCAVNLAGLPAVNIPAGWSSEGLPLGVSLVGGPGTERMLLSLAGRGWEPASGYRPRRPGGVPAPPPDFPPSRRLLPS
jgi:aspartyl-tRNA(Asn)/glutamyl-tRNA(Gln) amidotransferase subunit A